jgi:NagD protein
MATTAPAGVIVDFDGTICRGDDLIPGAAEALARLRRAGHPVVFMTNAVESPATFASRLTAWGIPALPADVVHAPAALLRYLDAHAPGAVVFAIGEAALLKQLAARYRMSDDPQAVEVVVASADYAFDFRKLLIAFHALRHGARFLATNIDPTYPSAEGEVPDAGAILGAIQGCTGRSPEAVVGKPSRLMAELALERLGRPAGETWIVGDSLKADIALGRDAGMTTALVLTGVTRAEDLSASPIRPDHVLESLSALPDLLERQGPPEPLRLREPSHRRRRVTP